MPDIEIVESIGSVVSDLPRTGDSLRISDNTNSILTDAPRTLPSMRLTESLASVVVEVGPVFYGFAEPPPPVNTTYLSSPIIIGQ